MHGACDLYCLHLCFALLQITQRLTVNLPRKQKMITRISPKTSLADVFKSICSEKNLDPYKHELRHPTTPDVALNMASALGDYRLSEITVIRVGMSALPPRLSPRLILMNKLIRVFNHPGKVLTLITLSAT